MSPLVIVDAENVRRSVWPNLTAEELVRRGREWARAEGHDLRVVFDGNPQIDPAADVVHAGGSADDAIVALAEELEAPFWVVTSDRELRRRLGGRAETVIGGGTFARTI